VPSGTAWHWVTYADAVRLGARLAALGQSLGTTADSASRSARTGRAEAP